MNSVLVKIGGIRNRIRYPHTLIGSKIRLAVERVGVCGKQSRACQNYGQTQRHEQNSHQLLSHLFSPFFLFIFIRLIAVMIAIIPAAPKRLHSRHSCLILQAGSPDRNRPAIRDRRARLLRAYLRQTRSIRERNSGSRYLF